ncbi:MAG: hypothetical protein ACRYGN_25020 [Janthinobacterium lividum]
MNVWPSAGHTRSDELAHAQVVCRLESLVCGGLVLPFAQLYNRLLNVREGDVNKDDLLKQMDAMAAEWRLHPHLSNDYSEGLRYNEIRQELSTNFNTRARITADADNVTQYYMVVDRPS